MVLQRGEQMDQFEQVSAAIRKAAGDGELYITRRTVLQSPELINDILTYPACAIACHQFGKLSKSYGRITQDFSRTLSQLLLRWRDLYSDTGLTYPALSSTLEHLKSGIQPVLLSNLPRLHLNKVYLEPKPLVAIIWAENLKMLYDRPDLIQLIEKASDQEVFQCLQKIYRPHEPLNEDQDVVMLISYLFSQNAPKSADTLLQATVQALEANKPYIYEPAPVECIYVAQCIRESADSWTNIWITHENKPIAHCSLSDDGEISQVSVDDAHRGRGLAQLLVACCGRVRPNLFLQTEYSNLSALRAYRRGGFSIDFGHDTSAKCSMRGYVSDALFTRLAQNGLRFRIENET